MADTVTVDVAVPPEDSVTDVGLNDTLGSEGEVVCDRVKDPEKPLRLARVMVDVPVEPC